MAARPETYLRPEGLSFEDANGNIARFKPLDGGGFQVIDVATGKPTLQIGNQRNYRKVRAIKRDLNGTVLFAGTDTDRGTTTNLSGQGTNTNLSASLQTTANFCRVIANLITTNTVTGGTAALKIMQGTNTLTSITAATPTGTVKLTATVINTIMTTPKAVLSNNVSGGTLKTMTLTEQLEDWLTMQTPLL